MFSAAPPRKHIPLCKHGTPSPFSVFDVVLPLCHRHLSLPSNVRSRLQSSCLPFLDSALTFFSPLCCLFFCYGRYDDSTSAFFRCLSLVNASSSSSYFSSPCLAAEKKTVSSLSVATKRSVYLCDDTSRSAFCLRVYLVRVTSAPPLQSFLLPDVPFSFRFSISDMCQSPRGIPFLIPYLFYLLFAVHLLHLCHSSLFIVVNSCIHVIPLTLLGFLPPSSLSTLLIVFISSAVPTFFSVCFLLLFLWLFFVHTFRCEVCGVCTPGHLSVRDCCVAARVYLNAFSPLPLHACPYTRMEMDVCTANMLTENFRASLRDL